MKKSILLFVILALGEGGCSYLTSSGRQQAAYARYVRHSSHNRVKLQRKFFASSPKIPRQSPTDPVTTTSAEESGPQSMTSAAADSPSQ